jgi:hypothetical protein
LKSPPCECSTLEAAGCCGAESFLEPRAGDAQMSTITNAFWHAPQHALHHLGIS